MFPRIVDDPKPWDNPKCFLCDQRPSKDLGSVFVCERHPEGLVRWSKYDWNAPTYKETFVYQGQTIPYVDFTKPDAPSSPA